MIVSILLLAAAPAATPAAPPPDRVICKSEKQLFSRIPVRKCQTVAQWEQAAKETQEDLRQAAKKRNSGDSTAN